MTEEGGEEGTSVVETRSETEEEGRKRTPGIGIITSP